MCKHVYVFAYVCHMRYICGYTCAWKKVFYTGRAPALCTGSVLHPQNNMFGIIDIGAHKPQWLQAPLPGFIYFMYISSTTSVLYLTPLYMNCMSPGNKHCFIVIIIVIVIFASDIIHRCRSIRRCRFCDSHYTRQLLPRLSLIWKAEP